jgi:hypothetical protein
LLAEDFAGTLVTHASAALAAPRRTCEVAFDFWQQVDTYERLKRLKQLRPALYEALPLPASNCLPAAEVSRRSPEGEGGR